MDAKTLAKIKRKVTAFKDKRDDFLAYDDMDNCKWDVPDPWTTHEWIRKRVSTKAHDMLKEAIITFDTYMPRFDIMPNGLGDTEHAEELERCLEWWMLQAAKHGDVELFREMIKSAAKYGRICVQLDYLPYTNAGESGGASFCPTVVMPHDVYYQRGKTGLEWVASISIQTADDVIGYWSAYLEKPQGIVDKIKSMVTNKKKVKSGIDKIKSEYGEEEEDTFLLVVDYTDKKKRQVLVIEIDAETYSADDLVMDNAIVIVDEDNKKGFIPWAIGEGSSDPLLAPLLKGNLWENDNFIRTMRDSSVIKRGWFPMGIEKSASNKYMTADFTGVEVTLKAPLGGYEFTPLAPPPIDPGLAQLAAINDNEMGGSVGIQSLSEISPVNVQASVFNNIVQLQLIKLEPYKRTFDKVAADLGLLMFMWIKKTKSTETAYRYEAKSSSLKRGVQIVIDGSDFDPNKMYITCDLRPNQYTDKLQKINGITMMKQAGIPYDNIQALEDIGIKNPEATIARWEEQEISMTVLQAMKAKIMSEVEIQKQKAIMEIQSQMQEAQMAKQQELEQRELERQQPPAQEGFPGGQGFAPPQGGESPMDANPDMTQTVMQGMNPQ